jgi:DNA polymerase III subunit delta
MRIGPEQLDAQLARTLAPLYAIHGDEPLLALEAADAVRAAARARGYGERELFQPERNFDWAEFRHAGASRSLFGDRKIVELRLSSGKLAAPAAEALVAWCEAPSAEALLLLTMPRPEGGRWWEAPWYTALEGAGVVVEIKAVERRALPRWLAQRLARQQQSAPPEVLEFLAARVEGNLLAAHQEVQKLALLAPPGELSLDTVTAAVANVARYDPQDAAEALLGGDLARYLRVIEGLRAEGEQPAFVLFVLSSALFALRGERLYNRRLQAQVEAAGGRFPRALVEEALAHAGDIDRAVKGVGRGEPWELLVTLGLKLAHGSKA